ncbi:MAG: hypothetical protein GX061_08190 [Eubacteriaceae bacterium]|nr:hypothetical protein [Eubacteriaceae bacterium]
MNELYGHSCASCSKANISRNEVGLNMKLIARNVKKFYCLDCLAKYLKVPPAYLLKKIQEFKEEGCMLFE